MRNVQISVSFDMRAPDWGTPTNELYQAALQMAAFADRIGIGRIGLMEDHGSEDGIPNSDFSEAYSGTRISSAYHQITSTSVSKRSRLSLKVEDATPVFIGNAG